MLLLPEKGEVSNPYPSAEDLSKITFVYFFSSMIQIFHEFYKVVVQGDNLKIVHNLEKVYAKKYVFSKKPVLKKSASKKVSTEKSVR